MKSSSYGFIFKKGNLYKIKKIEIGNSMLYMYIYNQIDDYSIFILGHYLDNFYNHFLSKIEYRKIKLKEINGAI